MPEMDNEYKKRHIVKYKNSSKKFICSSRNYMKQYCSIYLKRLEQMQIILENNIKEKWSNKYPIVKLHKLSETEYEKCIIIGTLFKDQKLKPSIIKDLCEANQLIPQPILNNFTDESDVLFIEDELQRYEVTGNIKFQELVTGISCALLGSGSSTGIFEVVDSIFGDYCPQIERPIFQDDFYILLLSGLDLVNLGKSNISLKILTFWLLGLIQLDEKVNSNKICRIIIAGNSIRTKPEILKPTISMTSRVKESASTIGAVQTLDDFLCSLSKIINVDIMPGDNDPSNHILPQQPLHYCMFPKSSKLKSLNRVSNPYKCSINDLCIIGSSGQPVRDILRFSNIENPLDVLENCIKWRHIAPTAPDTLGCFPFYNDDPFIFDECPHVFFTGNQKQFGTRMTNGPRKQQVRLISIPEFSTTGQICLLNLKNLECTPISFLS